LLWQTSVMRRGVIKRKLPKGFMSVDIKGAIRAGNILRDHWPAKLENHVNLYLGGGRCGASFNAFGLMNPSRQPEAGGIGNTALMHADHWHRGAFGMDYWLPIARLIWQNFSPTQPNQYRQELELYRGRLITELRWPELRWSISACFHPYHRDLLAIHLRFEATRTAPSLLLGPETDLNVWYGQHLACTAHSIEFDPQRWSLMQVRAGTADSLLALRLVSDDGTARLAPSSQGVQINFEGKRGSHLLLIGTSRADRRAELCDEMGAITSPADFFDDAAIAWERRWGESHVSVPVKKYQALWARSLFYVLSSYAPDVRSPAPPCGWSANMWPLHFPQDVSYIHPALLRLGHIDIARSWIEFYRQYLDNMRGYTRDVYHADGVMWAWEFPIGPDSQLLRNGSPNSAQYEIHNAAYPARMARETAMQMGDRQWTIETAWPIVRESARFFGSVLRREDDGTWGIHVVPSMGQDEMGGINGKNYLDALFSAQYCLQTALKMADELGQSDPAFDRWRRILRDGLAFRRLQVWPQRIYATCEGLAGCAQIGRQKHPVQLNPSIFLPSGQPDDFLRSAFEQRQTLCAGVRENFYHGWTLAAYWLAASHLGDSLGLENDLGQAVPSQYIDPDWIQIYETSGAKGAPFYVTSHGLYLQAMNDAIANDYWGPTQVGAACPAEWADVQFHRLHMLNGQILSGERVAGGWRHRCEKSR
jgi:hypothetical protein